MSSNVIAYDHHFDLDGHRIGNLGAPTSDNEAATKKYVDDNAGGSLTADAINAALAYAPLRSIVAGAGISVDITDPLNPIASATATGGGATLGANTFTDKQTVTQANANAGIFASTGYSLTGSNATSMIDLAGTWNTSGTPIALKLNITNTSSNAASKVFDFQVGGSTIYNGDAMGIMTVTAPDGQPPTFDLVGFGATPNAGGALHHSAARGTRASPTAVGAGDFVGGYGVRPYNGSVYVGSATAAIHFYAKENFTTSAYGTEIQFLTTAVGSTSRQTAMTIGDDGSIFIGNGGSVSSALDVFRPQSVVSSRSSTNSYAGFAAVGGQTGDATWLFLSGYPSAGNLSIREQGVQTALTFVKTTGNAIFGGMVTAPGFTATAMPASDPHVVGQLWNSSGIVQVSAG